VFLGVFGVFLGCFKGIYAVFWCFFGISPSDLDLFRPISRGNRRYSAGKKVP